MTQPRPRIAVLLGDPGAVVRWGLPVVSSLTRLGAAMTTGGLALVVAVLPRPSGGASWAAGMRLVAFAAAAWTVLAVAELVFTYGSVAGRPLTSAQFGDELSLFATQVGVGRALLGIVVAVAVLAAVALVVRTPTGAAWTSLLAVAALRRPVAGIGAARAGRTAGRCAGQSGLSRLARVGAAAPIARIAA